jgi:DNA-binding SARP family transcriptional activator
MATLRAHVSMLRGLLEPDRTPWQPADRLLTRPPGYLLRVGPDELDVFDFERLLRAARARLNARDAESAQRLLSEALALWRGGALSDAAHVEAARAEIARLEELRLNAVTLRVEANLVLRRHQEIVPELTHLVVKYPLHERFYVQLMVALSRSGRRADALAVYRRARAVLARELAVAPGLALRHAEAAILAGELE